MKRIYIAILDLEEDRWIFNNCLVFNLNFNTLRANSADDKLIFSYFSQKIVSDISCKLSS